MSRTQLMFSILAFMLWWCPTAQANSDDKAKGHFLEGKRSYAAGRYGAAIKSFKAAGAIRPSPILEFNIGRCHHNLGQIDEAIASYRRYLAAAKEAANRAQIQAWIAELEQKRGDVKDPYLKAKAARPPSSRPAKTAVGSQPAVTAEPVHEALLPETWAAPARPPAGAKPTRRAPAPAKAPAKAPEGPIYKQWWFWVGCAGAAVITGFIIYTATSSGSSAPPPPQSSTRGLVVHF